MQNRDAQKPKRRISFRFVLVLGVLAFILVILLLSPIFHIRQIDIIGNYIITDREILDISELSVGMNIFTFNGRRIAGQIDSLPYSAGVSILRELPDRVIIQINERSPVANIRLGNTSTYLLIDGTGMVLAAGQNYTRGLPRMTGLGFGGFSVGEFLQVDNPGVFNDILLISDFFALYDFIPDLVNFSNPRDIVIYYGNFEIAFGNMEDAGRKTRYISAFLQQTDFDRGFLDMRDLANNPRFRLSR